MNIRGLVVALAGLVLWSSAATAQPRGSYQQTCGNIQFDGYELSAVCADAGGGGRRSRLAVQDCRGDISNNNGRLTCSGGGRGFGGPDGGGRGSRRDFEGGEAFRGPPPGYGGGGRLPPGSWRGSCRNGSIEGPVLYAECARVGGGLRETSADLRSCRSFANINGRLACE